MTKTSNANPTLQRRMKTSGVCPAKPFTKRWLQLQRARMEETCVSSQEDDDDNDHDSDSTYVYQSENDSNTMQQHKITQNTFMVHSKRRAVYSTNRTTNIYKQKSMITSKAIFVQEVPPYKATIIRTIVVSRSMTLNIKPIYAAQS
jgi:hypothetical protein